ncbi:MAG: hypothetical protein M3120_02200, partial [Pseudomonadota bacterium]|nr:hypothetical protein [Pseudomonadota bacterium]
MTDLLLHLQEAALGSYAHLQGSLAENRADQYSDIDMLWEVPDQLFTQCLARLPKILSRVRPVASLRFDPDFQRSDRWRLVYIRFVGVPLFWRVDLDIFARSIHQDAQYDRHNSAARGYAWSATESALANAVAAVKAHLRRRDDKAIELLRRG